MRAGIAMNEIRIMMVDDHSLFRESLSRYFKTAAGFRLVGECSTAPEAISAFSHTEADVVLLDYDLGEELGSNLVTELKKRQRNAKILMVTAGMSDAATLQIMEAGASGIFLKHSSLDQLLSAIHRVAAGEMWMDIGAVRALAAGKNAPASVVDRARPLTIRQIEVMRGILDGFTNKEIAAKLKASESSVKAVIQELFQKAGVRTRSQLVRIAIEKHSSDWLQPRMGS
jgi:two-component system, NarL family, nitrate/nitrite response regulator NarL